MPDGGKRELVPAARLSGMMKLPTMVFVIDVAEWIMPPF